MAEDRVVAANSSSPASLYVVATPIGNLSDLSQRAIDCLSQSAWVAAEDTRVTRTLLNHIGSTAQLLSLHAHNEAQVCAGLIDRLRAGEPGALVSDAGTPAISDPGAILVAAAHAAGIKVIPVPGASAPIALLSAAGLAPGAFVFEGFLPPREKPRLQRLAELKVWVDQGHAHLLLFEAPHRISECVASLLTVFGAERVIVLGRELSKVFEEIHRCELGAAPAWLAANANRERGEFVLAVAAANTAPKPSVSAAQAEQVAFEAQTHSLSTRTLLQGLLAEMPLSQAVKVAQRLTAGNHRALYQLALRLTQTEPQ